MKEEKKRETSLLTGGIFPVLYEVSLPLIITNVIMSLYNLADGLWVAQVSMTDFTATSFVWPPHYLFVSLGMGLSIAGTAIIAQLLGQKDLDKAESYGGHLFLLSLAIGLFFSVCGYFLAPRIVQWMGAEGVLAEKSSAYLSILLLGFVFEMVFLSFNSILGAQGQTRITTLISTISSILNVVLDPFFIFTREPVFGLPGLGMGIAGAAWATVLSQSIKVFLGIIAVRSEKNLVRLKLRSLKLSLYQFRELLRTGFPTALGQSSAAVGFTLLNSVIVAYGEATMTAYAAVNRISGFLMMPSQGVGSALTAIIGQNMGAGDKERVKSFVRLAFLTATSMAILGGILQWVFRWPMLSIFLNGSGGNSQLVWAQALEYSLYSALITPLMAFFNLFAGIFSGAGYQNYAAYISIGRLWVIRLPMIYLFQRYSSWGSEAVWIAMLLSNVLIDVFGFYLLFKGKWFREPKIKH